MASVVSYVAGNTMVMTFFITLGICILIYAHYTKSSYVAVSYWLAWSLILCGISRGMFILCVWYGNLYTISGIISVITGIASIVTVIMMIPVVKKMIPLKDLEELNRAIKEAEEKLRTLQKLKSGNA